MKRYYLILVFVSYAFQGYSQDDKFKIFDVIISRGNSHTTELYIQCEKENTYFSKSEFKKQTGSNVPEEILDQIESNLNSRNPLSEWPKELGFSIFKKYGLKNKNCLTKDEIKKLFDETGRQSIIAISDPVFDEKKEHCVVSVTYIMYHGSASGMSLFLMKVYGKWVVLDKFDHWVS